VQLLSAEKEDLQHKLAAAEQTVRALGAGDPVNAQKFAEMNQQLAQLKQQLVESERTNDYLAARAAELGVQLDEASIELQTVKLNGDESEQLTRENEVLRNIIVRERQEEARRDQARKLVITELGKLRIRSDALNRQIEFLAQPVTTLSTAELALLRQPVVSVSDQQAGLFKASFVFEKKSIGDSISTAPQDTTATSGAPGDATKNGPDARKADVPAKLQGLVRSAKKNLQQGNFTTAQKQYQQILAEDSNNVDALSGLGVIYYRGGKLPWAEATLKKAVANAPENDFLLTTLGVIHYRQSKFDEAILELRKAITINPKSATAHNYLGIAASQKGRQQEAEKEILQALANNPNDADAHFNLAVILATTQPGSKELAREHYARATALGTQRSPSLEKLLQ
jgi:Flp pilus assembly protein TadD